MNITRAEYTSPRNTLPIILIAAVVQGWALYGLHMALNHKAWPATSPGWLLALYAVVTALPLTVQLLALHVKSRDSWPILAILTVLFAYFGWHHGSAVAGESTANLFQSDDVAPLVLLLLILWLLVMPFIQCRLTSGTWRVEYGDLFATAWRNKLLLGEAAVFTGLFWLLLVLWHMLFGMLGIRFFRELFREPIFVYPVTSLTFGVALHLIGSVERLTSVVLTQVLSVLKWLAIIAGFILALFSAALALKLPGLVFEGQRAIGAAWLLWLVAVIVLLVNAAYRDGTDPQPYPKWIALALRVVVPLTILISLTAIYALSVRVRTYGITVERMWAFVVAGAALVYSVGYARAALKGDAWMSGMSRVNVGVAIGLIATIAVMLTPVLSPYRISANSQYRVALQGLSPQAIGNRVQRDAFRYLRFEAGLYGTERLSALAAIENQPRAVEIREAAKRAMGLQNKWSPESGDANSPEMDKMLAGLELYPKGATLDKPLEQRLRADFRNDPRWSAAASQPHRFFGVFADLNGDGSEEFVLLTAGTAHAYVREANSWTAVGFMMQQGEWRAPEEIAALERGDVSTEASQWKDLRVGDLTYRIAGNRPALGPMGPPTRLITP
ncbi:MAG: hypothetical protein ABI885_14635 [Gammaproteobacteria bacterium]